MGLVTVITNLLDFLFRLPIIIKNIVLRRYRKEAIILSQDNRELRLEKYINEEKEQNKEKIGEKVGSKTREDIIDRFSRPTR